jgi:hypothetical protein
MIHGIYLRSKPSHKWHLVSVAASQEVANLELDDFRKQATLNGNDEAQVAIQIFDSIFWIPEYIAQIKEQAPQFN